MGQMLHTTLSYINYKIHFDEYDDSNCDAYVFKISKIISIHHAQDDQEHDDQEYDNQEYDDHDYDNQEYDDPEYDDHGYDDPDHPGSPCQCQSSSEDCDADEALSQSSHHGKLVAHKRGYFLVKLNISLI